MTNYRYLGYGVTDSNGVAKLDHDANGDPLSHSYTGVGAGEIDVVASLDNPITSSSIVSVPCNVLDATFYDKGLSGSGNYNDNWDTSDTISVSRDAEGTTLEYVPSASSYGRRFPNNSIKTPISNSYCIEFDVVNFNGYCLAQLEGNLASSSIQFMGYQLKGDGHFKGIIDGESYKVYFNDTKVIDKSLSNVVSTIFEFVFTKVQG